MADKQRAKHDIVFPLIAALTPILIVAADLFGLGSAFFKKVKSEISDSNAAAKAAEERARHAFTESAAVSMKDESQEHIARWINQHVESDMVVRSARKTAGVFAVPLHAGHAFLDLPLKGRITIGALVVGVGVSCAILLNRFCSSSVGTAKNDQGLWPTPQQMRNYQNIYSELTHVAELQRKPHQRLI